jgi:hypothetical protein
MKATRSILATIPIAFALAIACGGDDDDASGRGGAPGSGGQGGSAGAAGSGGQTAAAGVEESGTGGSAGSEPVAGEGGGQPVGGSGGVESSAGAAGVGAVPTAGTAGAGGIVGPLCAGYLEPCQEHGDCCSHICNPDTGLCSSALVECVPAGGPCEVATDCCSLVCSEGTCGQTQCVSDNQACDSDDECCSGTCTGGVCEPLSDWCLTAGNECAEDWECCSQLCLDGVCELGSSFCVQTGDICARDSECCSSICLIAQGNTVGTCADPPSGPTRCGGVEGMLCDSCNDCCSRLCVPYGEHGKMVCQPAQGCRILGDLCRQDNDCCGGNPDNGLPGAGNVTCHKEDPSQVLGVCRNPLSCSPQGNVCHYKADEDYVCTSSSAPNNCCGDPGGGEGMCQLDALGVPRCNGLSECVPTDGICSNSMDCCDLVPCVPWSDGLMHCGPEEGPPEECIPVDGPCTIDADCCPPYICIRPVGSTVGTCGTLEPPGGEAGAGGQGGQPGQAGQGGEPSEPCHQYGQICDNDADCCYDVPCTDGICKFPIE